MSNPLRHSPLLTEFYEQYLEDHDLPKYLRCVADSYFVGTLEQLVTMGESMARRGAVLALGRLADYRSNAVVGRAMCDLDRGVRTLAEMAISRLWLRVGAVDQQRRLESVEHLLEQQQFEQAAQLAARIIQDSPWIAQAWYQRCKGFFHMGQYGAALRDGRQALEINAYHFPAATLVGRACEMQRDLPAALDSYRQALRLNPNLEEVRARVIQLQRTLKNQ